MSIGIVRVLVVEDDDAWREFILSAVQQRPDVRVVAQVADGLQALGAVERHRPDLVMLDIGLPGLNGIEVARRMLPLYPDSRILFVSQETSEDVVAEALSTGAIGYLLKSDAGAELLVALNSVLLGKKFMSRTITRRLEGSTIGKSRPLVANRAD
jgi:DNA-binding NarL/FixJ family response regulator